MHKSLNASDHKLSDWFTETPIHYVRNDSTFNHQQKMTYQNTLQFAQKLDHEDPLKDFKNLFHLPVHEGKQQIYLCGNSLGLQPKSVRQHLDNELDKWQNLGVEGWFEGDDNWINYIQHLKEPLARIVGGKPSEVTVMNNLTINLHLMMVSFYQPTPTRYKV